MTAEFQIIAMFIITTPCELLSWLRFAMDNLCGEGIWLTTHLLLVLRLRISAALPPLCHRPS
jgi:hypothetical protein